jgi:POT family proton-dependent oligopeptide transporter
LKHLAPKKKRLYEYLTYAGSLAVIPLIIYMVSRPEATNVFMLIVGPSTLMYIAYEMSALNKQQNFRIIAAVLLMLFSVFFWAFFEQSGGSLSLFAASNLNDQVLGMKLDPNGVNNSANSVFVILFASLIGFLWIGMAKRKIEPNTIVKFGLAFLLLAGGFWLFYYTRFFANAQGVTSLDIFTMGWLVISIGEIFLSPIGMSTMTKLSPVRLQAVMMGMWFLASAYGQYFAGLLGADISKKSQGMALPERLLVYTDSYKQLALYAVIIGVAIIAISPWMKKLMGNVK